MTLCKHEGHILAPDVLNLFAGDLKVELPELGRPPRLIWLGAKLPYSLWGEMVLFLDWSNTTYRSESQLRLFYNATTGEWGAAAMPQYIGTGMFSEEIENHPDIPDVLARFPVTSGWQANGTIHHHCGGGAFQSGTDLADEKTKIGIHITIGGLGTNSMSTHCRATFRGVQYPAVLSDWVEAGEDFGLPPGYTPPEEWSKYLFQKPKVEYRQPEVCGYGRNHRFTDDRINAWKKWLEERKRTNNEHVGDPQPGPCPPMEPGTAPSDPEAPGTGPMEDWRVQVELFNRNHLGELEVTPGTDLDSTLAELTRTVEDVDSMLTHIDSFMRLTGYSTFSMDNFERDLEDLHNELVTLQAQLEQKADEAFDETVDVRFLD